MTFVSEEMIGRFKAFIAERENIRIRKGWKNSKVVLTLDTILRKYRFCNVNREHDTVTQWINKNIRKPYSKHPALWFNLCISRLFNWPETLERFGFVENYDRQELYLQNVCDVIEATDEKLFTGAYIVSTNGVTMKKSKYVLSRVLRPLWGCHTSTRELRSGRATCEEWAEFLNLQNGFSDFMTNQVVTDMKYTPLLSNALDRTTFVLAGPGTKRGLNRLCDRDLKAPWKRGEAEGLLRIVRKNLPSRWLDTFTDLNNLSNCFCEFDKYERVRLGQGRPRATYKPKEN